MHLEIQSDGWSVDEINEIKKILELDNVTIKSLAQFDFGVSTAIIIVVSMFGGAIISGIGNSIGQDIWKKLKSKFSDRAKTNKNSTIGFVFESDTQKIQLNIKTKDSNIIEKAFDTANEAIQKIKLDVTNASLFFDPKTQEWQHIKKQKFIRKITNPVANTDIVEQGGKKFQFTKEALERGAKQAVGLPITLGHGGKQIGEVIRSWVKDETLYDEIGIYEGTSAEDIEELDKLIRSGGGLSIGISFDPQSDQS